ncbi:MAG: pyrroline-5-carboxylate reductase, partial [Elusimicrobiota bacterium]
TKNIRNRIIISDIKKERLAYLTQKYGITSAESNQKAIKESGIIIISVKPQQVTDLLGEISGYVKPHHLVISVAAGITTSYIEKFLKDVSVIRTMPNTPVLVGKGMIVFCAGKFAKKSNGDFVRELFSPIGKVIHLDEKYFDAVTAISGSGPAYLFYLAEAMILAAKELGLDGISSRTLVKQTISGAAELMSLSKDEPGILRYRVTSPGGTTESAIKYLEENNFAAILKSAIKNAAKRSKELTR